MSDHCHNSSKKSKIRSHQERALYTLDGSGRNQHCLQSLPAPSAELGLRRTAGFHEAAGHSALTWSHVCDDLGRRRRRSTARRQGCRRGHRGQRRLGCLRRSACEEQGNIFRSHW